MRLGETRPRTGDYLGDSIIPVIPFMFTTGTVAIVAAAIVSPVTHFLVGAADQSSAQ